MGSACGNQAFDQITGVTQSYRPSPKALLMNKTVRKIVLGMMLVSVVLPIGLSLTNSNAHGANWRETKCALYQDYSQKLRTQIPDGTTSQRFDDQEAKFIASGCTARVHACPESPVELEYANVLSVAMMNEGATGSFLPFVCKDGLETTAPTQ